jgi:hypothetical protein
MSSVRPSKELSPTPEMDKFLSATDGASEQDQHHLFKFPYGVQMQHFSLRHPNTVGPFVTIMLSTYATCQPEVTGPQIDLDEAHNHVFGDSRSQACKWCLPTFKREVEHQKHSIR